MENRAKAQHSKVRGITELALLFNFEGPIRQSGNWKWEMESGKKFSNFKFQISIDEIWGYSSAGRAPALQAGGQRFDPAYLHQVAKGDNEEWKMENGKWRAGHPHPKRSFWLIIQILKGLMKRAKRNMGL